MVYLLLEMPNTRNLGHHSLMSQYEELLQRLEQIVETMGRIVSTQEENVKRLNEQVDILARIVWLEEPKMQD